MPDPTQQDAAAQANQSQPDSNADKNKKDDSGTTSKDIGSGKSSEGEEFHGDKEREDTGNKIGGNRSESEGSGLGSSVRDHSKGRDTGKKTE